MPHERLVAVSYPVDGEFTRINTDVLGADAYAEPIAEHVMAMTLALARRLPQRQTELARGESNQAETLLTLDGAVCAIRRRDVGRFLHGDAVTGVVRREDYA